MTRPNTPDPSEIAAWTMAERSRASLVALAAEIAPLGVELLVLKGLYIAFGVADTPLLRPMCDADALVVSGSLSHAVRTLRDSKRFELVGDNVSTKVVADRHNGSIVDLHRWPLPPRFGRMAAAALLSNARRAPATFGPHVLVPDPVDAAAIAVANYVKDSVGATGPKRVGFDLARLSEHAGLRPELLARRMTMYRLRRVGIVGLTALALEDPIWQKWVDPFEPTDVERRLAALAVPAIQRLAVRHPSVSYAIVRSIGDRVTDGSVGFAVTIARLARDEVRDWLRGSSE